MPLPRTHVATALSGEIHIACFERRNGRWVWVAPSLARGRRVRGSGPDCQFALPADGAWYRTLRVPVSSERARRRLVAFEASRGFPVSGLSLVWDSCPALAGGGDHAELLAGMRVEEVAALEDRLADHGMSLARIEPAGSALHRCFRQVHPSETRPGLLVDLGGNAPQVLAVEGPRWTLRLIGAVASGGPSLVERLHLEIARLVKLGGEDRPMAWGLVVGEASASRQIAHELTQRLAVPFAPFDVWPELRGSTSSQEQPNEPVRSLLPVLLGMAMAPGRGEPGLDLRPVARKIREARKRRRPAIAAAAAAVALSLGTLAVKAGDRADRALARVAEVEVLLPARREQRQTLEASEARRRELEGRIKRARWLSYERDRWPLFLRDLQAAMDSAGAAWVDRLEMDPTTQDARLPQVIIHGRLLDPEAQAGGVSDEARLRVQAMLSVLERSESVGSVVGERFSPDEPGILRFELCARLVERADEGVGP